MRIRYFLPIFVALFVISCAGEQSLKFITADGRTFFSEVIPIQWQEVSGATHYLVEVSSDGDFSDPAIIWRAEESQIFIGNGHRFNLEQGTYHYRVKPVFDNPLLGRWSAVQTFTYQPLVIRSEIFPESGRTAPGGSFSFVWELSAEMEGRGFIQLATDPLFQNIIWENPSVPGTREEVADLPEGSFYIRAGFSTVEESEFLFSEYYQIDVVPPLLWPVHSSFYLEEPWVELYSIYPDGRDLFLGRIDGFRLLDRASLSGGGWILLGTYVSPEEIFEIPVVLQLGFTGKIEAEYRLDKLEGYQLETMLVSGDRIMLFGNTSGTGVESQAVVCSLNRTSRQVDISVLPSVSSVNGRIAEPDLGSGVDRVERHLRETAIDGIPTPDGILVGGISRFSRTDWSGNHGRGVLIGQAGWLGFFQQDGSFADIRTFLGPHNYVLEDYLGKLDGFQTFYGQRISGSNWEHSPILVGLDPSEGTFRETDLFTADGWHPGSILWQDRTSEIILARHDLLYFFTYETGSSVLVPDSVFQFSYLKESLSSDLLNYTDLVIDSLSSCGPAQFVLTGRVVAEDNLASWCLKIDTSARKILWQYSSNDDFGFGLSSYPVEKLLYGEDWQPWMPDSGEDDFAFSQRDYRILNRRSGEEINFWATETEAFGEHPDESLMVKDLPSEPLDRHFYILNDDAYAAFYARRLIGVLVSGESWSVMETFRPGMAWEDVRPLIADKTETVPSSVLWSDLVGEYDFVYGVYTDETQSGALCFYVRDNIVIGILLEVYDIQPSALDSGGYRYTDALSQGSPPV